MTEQCRAWFIEVEKGYDRARFIVAAHTVASAKRQVARIGYGANNGWRRIDFAPVTYAHPWMVGRTTLPEALR